MVLSVEFALHSDSAEAKHVDIDGQGIWIADALHQTLRQGSVGDGEVDLIKLRYYGQQVVPDADPIWEFDF